MDNPMTPEAIAQDAMTHAAELATTPLEQYAFAKSLLRWEGEAQEVLEQQRTRWLLDALSKAPVQRGHVKDELKPRTGGFPMTQQDRFEGCQRGFTRFTKAHYAAVVPLPRGVVEEIMLGYYDPDGGTAGEMKMHWLFPFGSEKKPVAQLSVFEDTFAALSLMPDLVTALHVWDGKLIQPDDFCALLLHLGFKDRTATERD